MKTMSREGKILLSLQRAQQSGGDGGVEDIGKRHSKDILKEVKGQGRKWSKTGGCTDRHLFL